MKKDLDGSKAMRHEKSVHDVMNAVSTMVNPFNTDQASLVCISSGVEMKKA